MASHAGVYMDPVVALERRKRLIEMQAEHPDESALKLANRLGIASSRTVARDLAAIKRGIVVENPNLLNDMKRKQAEEIRDIKARLIERVQKSLSLSPDGKDDTGVAMLVKSLTDVWQREARLFGLDAPKRVNILSLSATYAAERGIPQEEFDRILLETLAETTDG